MAKLIRYWFEFKKDEITASGSVLIGCGVTALSYSDALDIMSIEIFKNKIFPEIISFVENVDIRNLDQGHVIPNMRPPIFRGVWFPITANHKT